MEHKISPAPECAHPAAGVRRLSSQPFNAITVGNSYIVNVHCPHCGQLQKISNVKHQKLEIGYCTDGCEREFAVQVTGVKVTTTVFFLQPVGGNER
jgi:hypothetical protein